ncbi:MULTISPECIES: hypothetical protein [Pseudomonas]|jgi:hypothetical protein|uniref:Uncharacterized protein n=1 Tax=Pseudomonas marginalis TaxID=298 RepID=A0A9X9FW07_PSEMA|nr:MULTISPECIES: hypothetical protein [Pseudomonas]MDT9629685.1 hypothetical protein [Pseudomonas sp. JV449]TKJ80815.1 hypothetical protein PspCFBP13509_06815 [Pseudomonas sp. CFBP13509]TWR54302.1 hypothetical protein FIV41_22630 [Pseudomonas marginalis]WGT27001.1 hypothetical protein QGQ83_25540 [Pseudomonas marginalis]CRM63883.1 hypothetical protein [Pseudomonas sp. 8 R 14]
MAKRILWKEGDLVSLKLRDDLYTVGQMIKNSVMRFYDVRSVDGAWTELALDNSMILFSGFVGKVVTQRLATEKLISVTPFSLSDHERYWLRPHVSFEGGFPFRDADLVDLGIGCDADYSLVPALKEDLQLSDSRDIIEKYELTNMWGDEDLTDRLCRYFDTGVNRDDLKFEVFPGLWNDRESLRPLTRRLPLPLR